MPILVSSCLLGEPCRYDGAARPQQAVMRLCERLGAVAVCPEVAGGLPTPRVPSERSAGRVVTRLGADVTAEYREGAARALAEARRAHATLAVLKAKSPSCGTGLIYDGSFRGRLVRGDGVAAELLEQAGITVVSEDVVAACEPSPEHPVGIILNGRLGRLAERMEVERRVPHCEPGGPPADALRENATEALVGRLSGVPVVVYPVCQGYGAHEAIALVRHAHALGCRDLVLVCTSEAVPGKSCPGLGMVSGHLNRTEAGPSARRDCVEGSPVDAAEAYSPYLAAICSDVAANLGMELHVGVLAEARDLSSETAAGARAISRLGVSFVGRSMAPEAVMARALGMNVLGLTLATRYFGEPRPSCRDEAVVVAADDLMALVSGVLEALGCA